MAADSVSGGLRRRFFRGRFIRGRRRWYRGRVSGNIQLMLGLALGVLLFERLKAVPRGVVGASVGATLLRKSGVLRGFGGVLKGLSLGLAAAVLFKRFGGIKGLEYASYDVGSGVGEEEQVVAVLRSAGYPKFPEAMRLVESVFGPGSAGRHIKTIAKISSGVLRG